MFADFTVFRNSLHILHGTITWHWLVAAPQSAPCICKRGEWTGQCTSAVQTIPRSDLRAMLHDMMGYAIGMLWQHSVQDIEYKEAATAALAKTLGRMQKLEQSQTKSATIITISEHLQSTSHCKTQRSSKNPCSGNISYCHACARWRPVPNLTIQSRGATAAL